MENQFLPPSEIAHTLPVDCSRQDSIRIWMDLMETAEKLVKARLVEEFGQENMQQEYRKWFAQRAQRHSQHMLRLARRLRTAGEK